MPGGLPTITVITPSLNQVRHLRQLLACMEQFRDEGVRHLVIDGGSADGTVDLLRATPGIGWISEPDRGQADALNKGLAMADSDIVAWVNCDDRYSPGAIQFVREAFAGRPDLDFLYGDALAVDGRGRSYGLRAHVRPCGLSDLLDEGDPIVQPAAFWRTSLTETVGLLDASLTYAFDYEYWMRVAAVVDLTYVPICLAIESMHGGAKTSRGGHARMAEIEAVAQRHGGHGVPRGFRAEAGALETLAAMRDALRGDLTSARRHLTLTRGLRPRWTRFAGHLVAESLPIDEAVPRLRLLANRTRSTRQPVWPGDPTAAEVAAVMGLRSGTSADEPSG